VRRPVAPRRLPGPASGGEKGDLVLLASGVRRDEREILASRLRHQHPVEGILVNEGEASGRDGVFGTDGQLRESAAADSLRQVCRLGELSAACLMVTSQTVAALT
jgi:hypothetical protein